MATPWQRRASLERTVKSAAGSRARRKRPIAGQGRAARHGLARSRDQSAASLPCPPGVSALLGLFALIETGRNAVSIDLTQRREEGRDARRKKRRGAERRNTKR